MQPKREQALVGLFVIVAAALLIVTTFTLSGALGRKVKTYHSYFAFAGGLEPGTTVRYSGGPRVGTVDHLTVDPKDPARFDVVFKVQSDVPIKADSHVRIMSLSPLGDNHLEVLAGSPQAALAPDGATLPSYKYVDFNALTQQLSDLGPQAQQLVQTLNDRATELKVTVERVNDLLSVRNRNNLAETIANARGMLEEDRPHIRSALQNVNSVTEKLQPLLEDFRKTSDEANKTLDHIDSLIGENRADIRQALLELRHTLANTTDLTGRLDRIVDINGENIDELLDNMRQVTENLREFSTLIKRRPYTLIRATNPREHRTGEQQ
jgi:phospholipid/cholesterol/gamma-HCH transport system substrate-binding protein